MNDKAGQYATLNRNWNIQRANRNTSTSSDNTQSPNRRTSTSSDNSQRSFTPPNYNSLSKSDFEAFTDPEETVRQNLDLKAIGKQKKGKQKKGKLGRFWNTLRGKNSAPGSIKRSKKPEAKNNKQNTKSATKITPPFTNTSTLNDKSFTGSDCAYGTRTISAKSLNPDLPEVMSKTMRDEMSNQVPLKIMSDRKQAELSQTLSSQTQTVKSAALSETRVRSQSSDSGYNSISNSSIETVAGSETSRYSV